VGRGSKRGGGRVYLAKLPTAAQILKKSRLHPWLYFTAVGYNPRFHSSRLAKSWPPFGGLRWWFVCPRLNRRVRKLYLPLGGRPFRSRLAYRLAYASQRETLGDRASRTTRKLCRRLGGDPEDDSYPDKPRRMRWNTYNRLMDKLVAADRLADYLADQRLRTFAVRCVGR
jgi:hypothetical protein